MNYKAIILTFSAVLTILFGASFLFDSELFPKGQFASPIGFPISLSGTYGELRSNHFHAGIDIRSSTGKAGDPIFAAADGYISRIKVRPGGYGHALYMNHPNGYSTVYGHLHEFVPAIQNYVKEAQYREQSFGVNLFPPSDRFRFKKGQQIGTMGNTGSSSGVHLHFEIRDQKTEEPLNAIRFGLPIKDKLAPKLHQIKLYHLDEDYYSLSEKEVTLLKGTKKYEPKGNDTLYVSTSRLGLGLKAYDHMEGSKSWNGVYHIAMKVDGSPVYDFVLDRFAFSETRYINSHIDYDDKVYHKSNIHKLYVLPGNKLNIYGNREGIIELNDYRPRQIDVTVKDVVGNVSQLQFWVKRSKKVDSPSKSYNYFLPYQKANKIEYAGLTCYFPQGSFYEHTYFKMSMVEHANGNGYYAPTFKLHNLGTPVQRYFNLTIPTYSIPAELRPKAYIAWKNKKGKWQNAGGKWADNSMKGKVRSLGDYSVRIDQTPPTITANHFKYDMSKAKTMSFIIKDDLPTTGTAKGLRYRATVDGQWILMEYDPKNDKITHRFDHRISKGEHVLRIKVTDDRGNEKVLQKKFKR